MASPNSLAELNILGFQDFTPGQCIHSPSDNPLRHCIHQLFEEQVERAPGAIAISFQGEHLTYSELNHRANRVAHLLLNQGVGPDIRVGICVERSLEMIVGLLGILKAGGAYVPLDPEYPAERLAFMLSDCQVSVLLTQQRRAASFANHAATVICLDVTAGRLDAESTRNPVSDATSRNLAYVMYTSGSTGQPKGVMVEHRNVIRLVRGTDFARFTDQEVFLQLAPLAFDASTLEIWGPLLNGGRLAIMPPGAQALTQIGEAIARNGVTTLWLTAGLFNLMTDEQPDAFRGVRQLLAGGDVLSVPHVRKVMQRFPECQVINGYGPTENTTFTCCHPISTEDLAGAAIPIGRPIAHTRVYVLDEQGQPLPSGVPGELYAGGEGVARGYWNRPELTAEKFVPDPFSSDPDARLYRTGDLVRCREDGILEFLGRQDCQVKLRGFRIELGEIEYALIQHPRIREAVVLVREEAPGDRRLTAYLVPSEIPVRSSDSIPDGNPEPTAIELRHFLAARLPDHMVPAAFVTLARLPLTPNGKVDRQALQQMRPSDSEAAYTAPRNETEGVIARIWCAVIHRDRVSLDDNFFDVGGHSLHIAQVQSQIHEQLKLNLPITVLFQFPTIRTLAAYLDQEKYRNLETQRTPAFQAVNDRMSRQREALARQRQLVRGR